MPEYFDISLIAGKTTGSKEIIANCLFKKFNLREGENNIEKCKYTLLAHKKIILGMYQDKETDFQEFCISIPDVKFYKVNFNQKLEQLTLFIEDCFKYCKEIKFALCGYEISTYYIWQLSNINEFSPQFLSKFPIIYSKNEEYAPVKIKVNLEAQDLFVY